MRNSDHITLDSGLTTSVLASRRLAKCTASTATITITMLNVSLSAHLCCCIRVLAVALDET